MTTKPVDDTKKDVGVELSTEEIKATLMEELRKELKEEVKAEIKAEAEKKKERQPYKETAEELKKANELVPLKLFKDKDKYNQDVLVILNGESWLIKRGVTVKVPRKVFNVLSLSDDQTGYAADIIGKYEEEFDEKKERLL